MIEEILPNVPLNFKTACIKDDGFRLVMKSKDTPNNLFCYKINDYFYYTPIELKEGVTGTHNIFFQDKADNLLVATRMEIIELIENTDGTILFSGSINGEKGTAVFTKVDNDFVFGESSGGSSGESANLEEYSLSATKLVNAINNGGNITPSEGVDGFSNINVSGVSLQEKTITANGTYEVGTSSAPYLFKKITVSVPATDNRTVETLQCYQNSDSGNCLYFNTSFSITANIEVNANNQFFNVSSDGTKINGIAQTITENTGDRITNSGGTSYTRNKKLDVLVSAPNKLLEVEFVKGNNIGITSFNFVTNKAQNGTSYENYRFANSSYYDGTTDCELVIYASADGPPSAGYYKVKK